MLPQSTIEVDVIYRDEHGFPRVATWDEIKDMDIATFLTTHHGFQLVFQDSDPNTRTTLGKCNWWMWILSKDAIGSR